MVQALRKVASLGRSVVCTIHQPSAELFFHFDDLLLLQVCTKACISALDLAVPWCLVCVLDLWCYCTAVVMCYGCAAATGSAVTAVVWRFIRNVPRNASESRGTMGFVTLLVEVEGYTTYK